MIDILINALGKVFLLLSALAIIITLIAMGGIAYGVVIAV